MNVRVLRIVLFFVLLLFFSGNDAVAQNLTGIWRGYFISAGSDQYKFEIQVEQSPRKGISGVSYSYLTTVFYGKATLTGNVNAATKSVLIQEIKTVDLRTTGGAGACIMKLVMRYVKSGNEEFLEGTYTSKSERIGQQQNIMKDEGCGGGQVFLRKVPTSDFYVEPFLRDNPTIKRKPAAPQSTITKAPVKKPPVPAKKPTSNPATTAKKPAPKTSAPVAKKPPVSPPKTDTIRKAPPVAAKPEIKRTPVPSLVIPSTTRSRQNELAQTIIVTSNEISVRLYDNGEVDDDTVSVYMDNRIALANKRLSTVPINLTLKLDNDNPEHVLVMVAENLGRIPPNTSIMIVQDGDKRYQVRITSTNQKNAMVRFKYQNGG
ncbi:MAG TPA: hypothetical protein VM935_18135 [Chitinophagaceae bacterium]|nr:hypothetical protein [Chitinophagaceae bacterium]